MQLPLLSSFYKSLMAISLIRSPRGNDELQSSANTPKNFRLYILYGSWKTRACWLNYKILQSRLTTSLWSNIVPFFPHLVKLLPHLHHLPKGSHWVSCVSCRRQHWASLSTLRECMLLPRFNQNTFYHSTLFRSSVLLLLSSTSCSKMRLCMEEERKRPFVSCDLYALCKPTLEQGRVLPFSCEVRRPPLGFWLTILPSVFTGGGCTLYKQSEFSTPNYLGLFTSTLSLVMFLPFIFLFS